MCHAQSYHPAHLHEHRTSCGCGPRRGHEHFEHHHWSGPDPAGGFGIRRPLRFLASKLELDEPQVEQLAAIINDLKTERAQAAVDDRRALALLADAVLTESLDATKVAEASRLRTESAERVQKRVADAIVRIHALLEPEQRNRLAYLLRTGTLVM